MSRLESSGTALTAEQRAVVDQPLDARVLVTAGPGAGKTHTLVHRLAALVERQELEAHEVLVLSFSRAAVRELRNRIDRLGPAARRIRVQTLDSWATRLLMECDPAGGWNTRPFDERVAAATEAIESGLAADLLVDGTAHVVVDEVQDLVDVRREMVQALLDCCHGAGFTVVGDLAQAVYGFQVADPLTRTVETGRFLSWLRERWPAELVELKLGRNFRARTDEARLALALGEPLRRRGAREEGAGGDPETRTYRDLCRTLDRVPSFGDLADPFVLESLRACPDSCAVLCRDNGQALLLSEALHRGGVPHHLRRSAQDASVPMWIAELLRACSGTTLPKQRFGELAEPFLSADVADVEVVWKALRRIVGGAAAGHLDLHSVRQAIVDERLPDELTAQQDSRLIVSTVHRAKGLEFDRVLVVEPQPPRPGPAGRGDRFDVASEARLLYVAMTRARHDLYRLTTPADRWRMRKDQRIGRWYVGGSRGWVRAGMEAGGKDVDATVPAGCEGFAADPTELWDYLTRRVFPGDEVTLRLLHNLPEGPGQSPPYVLSHDDTAIGVVSERFRRDLHALLERHRGQAVDRWPQRITGFRVDCVEAVAGSVAAGVRVGLGDHGVWPAPRLTGLGRFVWNGDMDGEDTADA